MYTNGSEEFNRLIETPNNKAIQKRLVFEDTGMVIDKFKTLIMYSSSNNQELQIGTTNMSYLDVEAFTDIVIFDGQKLRLECGVELSDGSMEYAPMGAFTAINVEKGLNSVKFTANDNMQKTEKLYTSSLTYPTTSDKIVNEICGICGIELATPIENTISVTEKLQGYTCREMIGFIAGAQGKFACFDRLGQLNLRWYSEIPIEKQNSLIWSFTKSQEPFIVDKIEIAKNTETKFTSGEGNNIIYHSNPLATQQITDDILDDLRGFSYSTSNIEMLDDIRLDIWDVIKVTYLDGNEYFIPCMSIRQNMGASSTYIESFSKSKIQNQYKYEGPTAQFINRMATELLITNRVVASKVDADYVQSHAITTDNLEAIKADIKYAVIEDLDADFITTEELKAESAVIKVAVVQELSAEFGDIKQLKSDVAKIDTLIFGTASGDVIQTTFANSVIAQLGDAQIKSAMIQNVSASKITAGTIYTDDVTIQSKNGQMMLKDNTIQISDGTRARVQIGKDASNDYSINVWDKSGNLMFSQGGITDKAIKSAIIRNDMVSENANIHAGKLDISSLFTEINKSSETIKATKIYLDEEKQTLEASFKSMTTTITDINDQIIVDNLIPYPYSESTITRNGITFTDNGDGTITANGTATEATIFQCKSYNDNTPSLFLNLDKESKYTLSGCPTGGSRSTYYMSMAFRNDSTTISGRKYDTGDGIVVDINDYPTADRFQIVINIAAGATVTNLVFKPMLIKGSVVRPWQPYELSRNGLKETITSQGTQLEVLNGQITSKIWEQDITTAIDNVNIGGTNLLVRTKTVGTYLNTTDGTLKNPDATYSPTMTGDITSDWIDVSLYDNVTITLYDTFTDTTHHGRYCLYDSSKNVLSTTTYNPRSPGSVIVDTSNASYMRITAVSCLTYRYKIEKGNKATDWSPAPQDTDANITTLNTKYSTLEQDVNSFKTTVSATYSTKTELQTTKSTLEQNLNSFKTTVSATYTTKEDFNALSIGGRNIIRGSYVTTLGSTSAWENGHIKIGSGGDGVGSVISVSDSPVKSLDYAMKIANNTSGNRDFTQDGVPCELGKQYTFSVWVKGNGTLLFRLWNVTTNKQDVKIHQELVAYDKWTKVIKTFTTGSAEGVRAIKFGITGTCESMMFIAPKLERGNKATDWTPAPEDMETVITSVQTVATQTANKFNWLVKSGTSATNFTLTDRMAELTAEIISLNGDVKVDGTMILDGAVTANKIAIGDFTNLSVLNPDTYVPNSPDNYEEYTVVTDDDGSKWFEFGSDTTLKYYHIFLNNLPGSTTFKKGDKYLFRGLMYASAVTSVRICLRAFYSDGGSPAHTNMASVYNDTIPTEQTYIQIPFTINALPTLGRPIQRYGLFLETRNTKLGIIYARELAVHQMINNVLIADGAITADKINVNDLFAQDIVATGSITSPILKSSDYKYSSGDYSSAGMLVDLKNKLIRTPKVAIKPNGSIVAKDGTFTGTVNASEGKIGNITIQKNQGLYYSPTTASGFGLWATTEHDNIAFHAGANNSNIGGAPFRIYHDGSVVAGDLTAGNVNLTGGKIGNWSITDGILIGTGNGRRMALYPNGQTFNINGTSTTDIFFLVVYGDGGKIFGLTINGVIKTING